MTTANQWIINMINRLAEQFNHCGFSYGYDSLAEQHIIELSDSETLNDNVFRLKASKELSLFIAEFPNEAMLFTDCDNELPLEPPIVYQVPPTYEAVWNSYYVVEEATIAVTFDNWSWHNESVQDVLSSVIYNNEVTLRTNISVALNASVSDSLNYAMAA